MDSLLRPEAIPWAQPGYALMLAVVRGHNEREHGYPPPQRFSYKWVGEFTDLETGETFKAYLELSAGGYLICCPSGTCLIVLRRCGDKVFTEHDVAAVIPLSWSVHVKASVMKHLLEELDDPNATKRTVAAETLGRWGAEATEAVPALEKKLDDDVDKKVRQSVCEALNRIRAEAQGAMPGSEAEKKSEKGDNEAKKMLKNDEK